MPQVFPWLPPNGRVADVIEVNVTGYGYEFNNVEALEALLVQIAEKPEMITELKTNCLKKVDYYSTNHLFDYLKIQWYGSKFIQNKKRDKHASRQ